MHAYKIRTCDCGRVITGHKIHCSAKCRSRVNMRRMRERKRIEQEVTWALEHAKQNAPVETP